MSRERRIIRRRHLHRLRRVRDFGIGLSVFVVAYVLCAGDGAGVPSASAFAGASEVVDWGRPTDRRIAVLLFGLAFASIVAFNLALARHLRRVTASPRRGVWRRGRRAP